MEGQQHGRQGARVVLQVGSGQPSETALRAAIRVAQAFQSEIESLLIENQQLIELASFSFAREISLTGRSSRALTAEGVVHDMQLALAAARRRMEAMARAAEVPLRHHVVRDDPVSALRKACEMCEDWTVLAMTEPLGTLSWSLDRLVELIGGLAVPAGILLVGPRTERTTGPVLVALETIERLPRLMHAAERLTTGTPTPEIDVLIIAGREQASEMEGHARLILVEHEARGLIVRMACCLSPEGAAAAIAEEMRRRKAGFIVAEPGGVLVPAEGDVSHLAAALECPMLIVR